ncbi:MAG: glyoxalase/bleomycin resistance/extradiol dioxygenase family protein [Bacteroidota bacterium]
MALNVYLFFNGNCEEALEFYKGAVDGTTIEQMQRYGDTPMPSAEEQKNKIMHAVMHISGTKVMASDADGKRNANIGDNFSLALDFEHDGDMQRAFDYLSGNGGQATMPLQDTFWGAKFGMCTDKFGVNWMFNHEKKS